jgi:hypothetical protein
MATTGSGRGPIKVGSGYIEVYPKIEQKKLREAKAEIEKQMGLTGKRAGKAFADGIAAQVATIPKKAKAASDKAQKEIQRGAQDSKKVLKRIEKEITTAYGAEAGKRFREAAELEKKKQKLLDNTSASTRRALQATVREEQQAARSTARSWEAAERERLKQIRDREKAAARAAREEVASHRRAQQQIREELRRTITEARQARLQDLRSQMDVQRDQAAALRNQLRDYRRQMDDHTRSVGRGLTTLQTGWRRQGDSIERLGTTVTETGRLVATNLLAPLGAVAGALTTIGVKSADMRILGQLGLTAAGVSKQTSANEMRKIQQYAIDTPFSIDVMHEYEMKLIRSIAGNDKTWYDPKTKTAAADRAARKTSDIIMAVGDTMARAGNLDSFQFQRAMYAVDRIMDMDKAPTRNINQLVQATGIPAGELAQMFGFENAGAFWKQVGTPVAKGGGIAGQDMINNLLRFWDPNYFLMGEDGKPKIDPKTGQPIVNAAAHSTAGGSKGYGESMTSATITGRIQQVKERAQFELGSLFARENPETGEYEYTGLGEAIMGKKTPVYKRDAQGELTDTGKVTYEGGLLQDIQALGADQKGNVITLLKTSFEALGSFVEQIQWMSDWLEAHPKVKEVFADLLKMAAVALPWVLAIGLMTKTVGKLTKILASALTPLTAAFKGIRGVTRFTRQTASAVRAGLNGDGDAGSIRDRMTSAYRDRRTQLRGGDIRGPIARTRDRITGRDSGLGNLRGQIRDTEDAIRATEERITGLHRQIREVNGVSIRQLVDAFAGSGGSSSLSSSASTATTEIRHTQTQVNNLNGEGLGDVRQEFTDFKQKVDDSLKAVRSTSEAVSTLDGKKLTSLKVTVDTAHGTVIDLKNKIDDTSSSVSRLDAKKLDTLRSEFSSTTTEAGKTHQKVKDIIGQVNNLNGKSLSTIRGAFHGSKTSLYNSVNDVYKLLGTSNSGVNGRVVDLNNRGLGSIILAVSTLKDGLDDAGQKAKTLNDHLTNISNHAPGGGGGNGKPKGGSGKTKKATGGVLPGYTPNRDVHTFVSPTAGTLELSGGESVMRPEFTRAVGPEVVNRLNQIARTQGVTGLRKSMKFAKGGILDKLGIQSLIDGSKNFNIWPDALAAFSTMTMDSSSRKLGGDTQKGVVGAGTDGSHFVGGDLSQKFKGIFDFMSKDTWKILRRIPIPNGFSQVIGALGGAIAPVAGEYAWNDVWKGQGNVLERGSRFIDHLISTETIKKAVSGFFGGAWDSVKSLFSSGKALLTDPASVISDSVTGIWEMAVGQYNSVIGMVKTLREIWTNPRDYASQVIGDIYSTAKENLPNLEGLFDFSGDGLTSSPPDVKGLINTQLSTPGPGGSVTRWTPQVQMVLRQLGLPLSDTDLVLHRIQVESGGNPKAINLWDSNAKAGHPSQGLMQTIPSTFNAYAGPYRSRGITDPLASIYAGLNYAVHRYGSGWRRALSGVQGYWTGTLSASPGLALVGERGPELIDFRGGERVYSNPDTTSLMTGGRPISVTVHEAKHETTPQAILRGFQWIDAMYGDRI